MYYDSIIYYHIVYDIFYADRPGRGRGRTPNERIVFIVKDRPRDF